jgi:hypothetical protein
MSLLVAANYSSDSRKPFLRDPSDHLDDLRISNPLQVRHVKILKVDEAILCPE